MKKYLILLFFLASCASPKLTRNDRGGYDYQVLENPESALEVNVSLLPLPPVAKRMPEKPKTFFDLPDSVAQTFLKVIGAKAPGPQEIIQAIREPLSVVSVDNSDKTVSIEVEDHTTFQARLFFSNAKRFYKDRNLMHPNTRLEFLTTRWKLKDESLFSLVSIDKIENEKDYIDMGSLERVQDVSFGAQAGIEAGMGGSWESTNGEDRSRGSNNTRKSIGNVYDKDGRLVGSMESVDGGPSTRTTKSSNSSGLNANVGGKAELKYANNEMIKEAMQVKRMRLKTGFSFSSDKITISQRGGPLSDISDNVIVTATLKASGQMTKWRQVTLFSGLFTKDQALNAWNDIRISTAHVQYIACPSSPIPDTKVLISYEGAIRSVKNQRRGRHALEYDDKVVYYAFEKGEEESSLMGNRVQDMCQNVYAISAHMPNGERYTLTDENGQEILVFGNHNLQELSKWFNRLIREKDVKSFQSRHRYYFMSDSGRRIRISAPDFDNNDLINLAVIRSVGLHIRQ